VAAEAVKKWDGGHALRETGLGRELVRSPVMGTGGVTRGKFLKI